MVLAKKKKKKEKIIKKNSFNFNPFRTNNPVTEITQKDHVHGPLDLLIYHVLGGCLFFYFFLKGTKLKEN